MAGVANACGVNYEEACMRALCDPDYRNVRQFALR